MADRISTKTLVAFILAHGHTCRVGHDGKLIVSSACYRQYGSERLEVWLIEVVEPRFSTVRTFLGY